MVIALILAGLWVVLETVVLVKQMQREQRLEEITNRCLAKLDLLRGILEDSEKILNENPRLKEAFAHDDEVGDYFKNLIRIQENLQEPFGEKEHEEK